jgi:hypothetical protein
VCPKGCRARIKAGWQEDSAGQRRIRGSCAACDKFLRFLPLVPRYVEMADAAACQFSVEVVLAKLQRRGLEIVSDGDGSSWFPYGSPATADDRALLRQYACQISYRLGDTNGRPR